MMVCSNDGWTAKTRNRFEIARLGRISPLSYFWNAFFPPPRIVPACTYVNFNFLRMARISIGFKRCSDSAFN